MNIEVSERLSKLPPYLFVKIDEAKQKAKAEGKDVIDLGIGDPDIPTLEPIVEAMKEAVADPAYHRYPSNRGLAPLREAIAKWHKEKFDVDLNPATEILPLIGTKEGIAHIHSAFLNEGDVVLATDPGYPVYKTGCILAGGEPYAVPLLEENGFLPDLKSIPGQVAREAKLFFMNYPNNPTAALADKKFFEEVIEFAKINNVIICHDSAYSEIFYEERPLSFLQLEGAKEVGIEFHSCSKTYNMTGWRIGWAAGNADVMKALATVKSNIDSGVFEAVQMAAVKALSLDDSYTDKQRETFKKRRDVLINGLSEIGWRIDAPKAAFYVWTKIPKGFDDSASFCQYVLEKAGIVITPGVGFGKYGEGYCRMALTVTEERIKEAVERFSKILS